jgi:hypothetical protein
MTLTHLAVLVTVHSMHVSTLTFMAFTHIVALFFVLLGKFVLTPPLATFAALFIAITALFALGFFFALRLLPPLTAFATLLALGLFLLRGAVSAFLAAEFFGHFQSLLP